MSTLLDSPPQNNSTAAPDAPRRTIFEPPDSFAVAAISFNKGLVCAFAVVLAVLGGVLGFLKAPTYEASASLQVGQVNPNSPSFLGYTQSAASLAAAFSRSIAAAPVLAEVERDVGISRGEAISRLAAEPIPEAPVFRVIATGPSAGEAIQTANVAAGAVVAYEAKSNSANPQAASLLTDYRRGTVDLRRAEEEVSIAEGDGGPGSEALLAAEARRGAARVKLDAIERAYFGAVTSQAPRSGLVTLIAGATSASGDRKSNIQLFAFLGLLIGIVLGAGVAILRERRLPLQPSQTRAPLA